MNLISHIVYGLSPADQRVGSPLSEKPVHQGTPRTECSGILRSFWAEMLDNTQEARR